LPQIRRRATSVEEEGGRGAREREGSSDTAEGERGADAAREMASAREGCEGTM